MDSEKTVSLTSEPSPSKPGRVLISGASGLVGAALAAELERRGWEVVRLVRTTLGQGSGRVLWDPAAGLIDRDALEGLDAVVHLAGENIAARRWTEAQKARIRDSRVGGTRLLCEALASLGRPPATFLCASATGFYGNRGQEELDETSAPGMGFLADCCRQWEAACAPVAGRMRVVHARLGMVLSAKGGALAKMLPLFRLGLGGPVGSGRQMISWIALEDAVNAMIFILDHSQLQGPVNLTSPDGVTNAQFAQALGRALGRPAWAALPGFAARLVLGEMAEELLLSGAHVLPRKLMNEGFMFQYTPLGCALDRALAPACPLRKL